MSFIQKTHSNPGAVPKRMDRWSHVIESDLIVDQIQVVLDATYKQMFKITPYKTGYLRNSEKVIRADNTVQMVVTAYYAAYVNSRRPFWTNSITGLSIDIIAVVRNIFQANY